MDHESASPAETKKRKPISIGFLIAVLVLGVAGYFAGPYIMTYAMLLQERAKAEGPAIQNPLSEERPSMPMGES